MKSYEREIKFRAWEPATNTIWDVREIEWADGQILDLYLGLHSTGNPDDAGVSVLQFTGLTGKDGTEIYEGDWFRPDIPNSRTAMLVEWDEHKASYKPFNDPNYNYSSSAGKIIGNKYENPELIDAE
ncbi:YopX family protein [uncultured Erythrobacter sp.]|uniref:YopX family protein n=1 Tax=uncultured Erythrobacter sp. TaxID=263913 RepID=UPI002618B1B1|nr:YopX family protein [uncultured Erythrobacter sp.]